VLAAAAIEEILGFWFGSNADDAAAAAEKAALWWKKDARTDQEIARRFAAQADAAREGRLADWSGAARGRLALILLTDQFPRSIHRNQARAFAADPVAQTLALDGVALGHDRELRRIERVFFYLPLEHAESKALQEQSTAHFSALEREADPSMRAVFADFLNYAVRHRAIIERFGRFPHRNAALGRTSTPEEEAFLRQPGSSF
jgi:uncharacterized protein (DUF924 family)